MSSSLGLAKHCNRHAQLCTQVGDVASKHAGISSTNTRCSQPQLLKNV